MATLTRLKALTSPELEVGPRLASYISFGSSKLHVQIWQCQSIRRLSLRLIDSPCSTICSRIPKTNPPVAIAMFFGLSCSKPCSNRVFASSRRMFFTARAGRFDPRKRDDRARMLKMLHFARAWNRRWCVWEYHLLFHCSCWADLSHESQQTVLELGFLPSLPYT